MTRCSNCGNNMDYIEQYGEWYCYTCRQYQQDIRPSQRHQQYYDGNYGSPPPAPSQYPAPQERSYEQPAYYDRPPADYYRRPKERKIGLIVALIAVGIIIIAGTIVSLYFLLSDDGDSDKILGSWELSDGGEELGGVGLTMTFKKGGNGEYLIDFLGMKETTDFSWSLDENDGEIDLTMTGNGDSDTDSLKYKFIDYDTLELTDDDGDSTTWKRV